MPGSVKILGRLGEKLDACVNHRLLVQDIDRIINPFRTKTEVGGADWRSEYWGKWFTSLALADTYCSTPATRALRDKATKELIATAAPDGYIGTRAPTHRLDGWDVWGCKYALLGLIADYDRSHDKKVLDAAKREADVLMDELGPGKIDIADVGEWNGLPASSVLEPIVLVYERSGEKKYLTFAKHIVACWSLPSKRLPKGMRLVEDALDSKKPDQMCSPKSYEMMSCFEGLCELYRATRKPEYLTATKKLADAILREEATIVGVGTSGEVWFSGANKQTGVVSKPMETCVTVTWMKLCDQLLRLTGDARYADELEKNLYNGLLGAMMPDGRWWAYFSGMMGVRVPSYVQHADVGLSCCVVNGPRGLMLTPFWAFMRSLSGPVVNLYAPATATIEDVKLKVDGDYPVSDHVTITVRPRESRKFAVSLRIPGWSEKTEIRVNGTSVSVTPGYTNVFRKWHSGDRIQIHFDMRPKTFHSDGQVAIQRGPNILSLDNRLTPSSVGTVDLSSRLTLQPNPAAAKKIRAWMAFDLGNLTFCDYASAGSGFSETNTFRTWLPESLNMATVYDTGQTWQTLTHASTWTNPPEPLPKLEDRANDLALASNGATATSDSEYSKEPGSTNKVIDGIIATPDDFSNRWHSSIDSPHPHWIEIHLAKATLISRVVIHFADPEGVPVNFEGTVRAGYTDQVVFAEVNNQQRQTFAAKFSPIKADSFRLTIHSSANSKYPNASQISEIEIYR